MEQKRPRGFSQPLGLPRGSNHLPWDSISLRARRPLRLAADRGDDSACAKAAADAIGRGSGISVTVRIPSAASSCGAGRPPSDSSAAVSNRACGKLTPPPNANAERVGGNAAAIRPPAPTSALLLATNRPAARGHAGEKSLPPSAIDPAATNLPAPTVGPGSAAPTVGWP